MKVIKELRLLPKASRLYLLTQFLGAFYFVWPVFILYMSTYYSIVAVGVFTGAAALSQMLLEIPTGYLADRFGQARAIVSGRFIRLIGVILLVSFHLPVMPLISGLLFGLGGALYSGASDALIYQNVTHKEYEETMHHQISVWQAGLIISAVLGGLLYKIAPFVPFVAEGVVLFLATLPMLGLKEVYTSIEDQITLKDAGKALKRILTTKATLIFLAGFVLFESIIYLFLDFLLEKRMIELSISPSSRGFVIGGTKIIIFLLLQFIILRLVNTVAKKLYVCLFMLVLVFPLMGFGHSAWFFIFLYLPINVMTATSSAAINPLMQKLASDKYRATELSLYSMAYTAVYAFASLGLGVFLVHHTTNAVFLLLSILALVIMTPALIWSLRRYHTSLETPQPGNLTALE